MTAYVIYEAVLTDPEQYEQYKVRAAPTVTAAGGHYIVRGGALESFEGPEPGRVVIVEFPTLEAATAWYRSEEYTEAKTLREGACEARMFVVDGID